MTDATRDTLNRFLVTSGKQHVTVLNPPRGPLTKDDALVFAAWLVTCSMATREEFLAVLDEVEST